MNWNNFMWFFQVCICLNKESNTERKLLSTLPTGQGPTIPPSAVPPYPSCLTSCPSDAQTPSPGSCWPPPAHVDLGTTSWSLLWLHLMQAPLLWCMTQPAEWLIPAWNYLLLCPCVGSVSPTRPHIPAQFLFCRGGPPGDLALTDVGEVTGEAVFLTHLVDS